MALPYPGEPTTNVAPSPERATEKPYASPACVPTSDCENKPEMLVATAWLGDKCWLCEGSGLCDGSALCDGSGLCDGLGDCVDDAGENPIDLMALFK